LKSILTTACLLFLSLCIACGKDSPLEPPARKHPELLPLAEGARWEYRYYYFYSEVIKGIYGDNLVTETLTGKYTLSVTAQDTYPDSIIYLLNAFTEPDTGSSAGEESWQILYRSDTLWYKTDSAWVYMMPATFVTGGYIDMRVFLPPIGRRYYLINMGTLYNYSSSDKSQNHNYINWFCESSSYACVDSTGVFKISLLWCRPFSADLRESVWLVNYTPG
jgi:hypothetical protein